MNKGFSLIEIVFVVAIAGILTSIITNSFRTSQIRKEQEGVVESLVAHLEKQKADTQAGKGGIAYGVRFASTTYTLINGTTYSASATTNMDVTMPDSFSISETISNSGNVIYFSKLTGGANETATITVSHISNRVSPQYVTVQTSGNVSVVE